MISGEGKFAPDIFADQVSFYREKLTGASIEEGESAIPVEADDGIGGRFKNLEQLSRVELVFKDGIAYDPKKLVNSVRGMLGIR